MTVRKGYAGGRKPIKAFSPKRAGTLKASRTMRGALAGRLGRKGGRKGY